STTNSSPTIFNGLPLIRLDGALAGSGVDGLRITAGNSTIRGLVITRFTSDAIEIVTNGNNVIEGCLLGIDTANTNRANSAAGVHIVSTPGNRIGGTATGARNVISGNSGIGVHLENLGASNNIIVGNLIGTDLLGAIDRGNVNDGIQVDDAPNNIIGGTTAAERNVISGNNGDGVEIFTAGASGNQVLGNFIGTDVTGALPIANNVHGVYFTTSARGNIVGTVAPGAGNRIAFNGGDGVFVNSGTNNSIRGNAIFANGTVVGELGIDLGTSGITANDVGDADTGANQLQNFPLLTGVTNTAGGVIVAGTLDSRTNTTFTLDFYSNLACDTAGNGEGETYLGSTVVTTDGAGSATFGTTLSGATMMGRFVTATATDGFGNTSEFSPCASAASTALPQTFTVVNTDDSGVGSLRAALEANNARVSSGPNTISFNIPNAGPHAIAPTTALPQIIEAVVIDGYTQPGTSVNTLSNSHNAIIKIILSGANAPVNTDGLNLFAGNCVVRGLSIVGFGGANGDAVFVSGGTGSRVEGCLIGLEPDGSTRRGNGGYGVHITPFNSALETSAHTIGGLAPAARNVISANRYGVYVNGSGTNLIVGNHIGTDAVGRLSRGNTNGGVYVIGADSRGNQIGGPGADYRNVISGNGALSTSAGVTLETCSNSVVAGNFIGVDATGTNGLFNDVAGLRVRSGSTNIIGGLTLASANVISGNDGSGLVIDSGSGNRIQGNLIGTDVTGTRVLSNEEEGIDVNGGSGNVIGGLEPGAGNVISGNGAQGIEISSSPLGAVVQGNFIGTDRTGNLALGNGGFGVQLTLSRHRVESNVIAFNRGIGVYITSGDGNTVTANSIHSNTNLGIDLGNFGTQANDIGDPDNGVNGLQNYPVLTGALRNLASTSISGTLNSAPNQSFRLEFFDNLACDSGLFGEGQTYLGFLNVTTDGSGNAGFTFVHPSPITFGHFITATATDTNGSTSEFSRCVKVIPVDSVDMAVTMVDSHDPAPLASNLIYTVTVRNNGPTSATDVVVSDVLPAGVNFVSAVATQGACNFAAGVVTCNLGGIARAGIADVTITVRPTAFGFITNSVSVVSAQFDHTPENNVDTEVTQAGVADMVIAISANPDPVGAGQTLTFTITAINLGPDPAPAANLYFSVDDTFCVQSAVLSQGALTIRNNFFQGALGFLPVNASATLTVTGVASHNDPLFSGASTSGGVFDPNSGNNATDNTTTVLPGAGLLQFELSNFTASEGTGTASITVIRTGGSAGALSVQYTTTNGTALAGSDYTAASGTLSFAAGVTTRQFTVPLSNDTNSECNEILGLRLFNATGGGGATVLCPNIDATLTITDDDGVYAGAYSSDPSVSADGRFVAFQSDASDLVPGDDNFDMDVFVRDLVAGTTRLISRDQVIYGYSPKISGNGSNIVFRSYSILYVHIGTLNTNQAVSVRPDGNLSSSSAYDATVSSNGNVIAFTSFGTDLVTEPDVNFASDVFVRDVASQTTVLVSAKLGGNGSGNGHSYNARISADGCYVVFLSEASDLVANDTNGATDVFLRDLQAGTTTLVSRNHLGTGSANDSSVEPAINADGRYVAFTSYARDVVANDNTFSRDVFLFDRIAGTNRFVSVNRFGSGPGNSDSYGASISANGRFIAFESAATNLVSNDQNGGIVDVFVRDVVTGTTVLVSLDCSGLGSANSQSFGPVIAGDGRSVAFLSFASDLTSGDFGTPASLVGGTYSQLFRRDLTTNRTELLSRNVAQTGGANDESYEAVTSFQGITVAFSSYASDLVEHDDNNFDSDVFAWSSSATPPEPVPTLTITRQGANQVTLSWPSPSTGFNLESAGNLNSPIDWTPVTATVSDNGLLKSLTLFIDTSANASFFQLRK
ncbi:MAG TPA: Calx-beta domain-containing protein, partial [Candidatus Acidoferrum sp.]|nr:Calx-beta domain-containing protein [Candidatus Acidoferrum sp.]